MEGVVVDDGLLWQVISTLTEYKGGNVHNSRAWQYSRHDFVKATFVLRISTFVLRSST